MNKVILIGNLTKDPEFSTPNNIALCKFSIAVSRRFDKNETDYFPISVWRGNAENCQKFLKKGSKVAIVGSVNINSYEAHDGSKRTSVNVTAEEVEFLKTENMDRETVSQPSTSRFKRVECKEDELPF